MNHFVNPRIGLEKVTKRHNLPIKRLKVINWKSCKIQPQISLAWIPAFNPRYIWGSGVFNTPLQHIEQRTNDISVCVCTPGLSPCCMSVHCKLRTCSSISCSIYSGCLLNCCLHIPVNKHKCNRPCLWVSHNTLFWNSQTHSVNDSIYKILTECFWKFQGLIALWECCKHALLLTLC